MRIFFISFFFLLVSCRNESKSLIFTTNRSMDPNEPRFGIEIKNDTIFYCEEIISNRGKYNYYYCITDYKIIQKSIKEIEKEFDSQLVYGKLVDATLCQINIKSENDSLRTTFYIEELTGSQEEAINKLLELKACKFKKLNFHLFPSEMLRDELPIPPPR